MTMAMQWLSRLFNKTERAVPEKKRLRKNGANSPERLKTPTSLFKEYFAELDQAFCFMSMEVTVAEPETPGPEVEEQAKSLVRSLQLGSLKLENLPRRPASLPMLIKVLKDEDMAFSEIEAILLSDPALTSRILNTANSPYFKINTESVDSIDQAIRLLGNAGIRRVISATVMNPVFRKRSKETSAFGEHVWNWALMSGTATDQFGRGRGMASGSLYLLGLLPALAVLLIHRGLEDAEAKLDEGKEIDVWTRLAVIRRMRWSLVKRIRAHWGLSEDYDEMVDAAEHAGEPGFESPLHDALVVAMYAYLKDHGASPLNEQQVFTLTSTSAEQNHRVLKNWI